MGGGGGGGKIPTNPPFEPEAEFPTYIDQGRLDLSKSAANADRTYYRDSDKDFKRRHHSLFQAEKLFEKGVLRDQQGESELTPALQAEFMRAGLVGAGNTLGDSEALLTPGSAGEASIARNLGLNIAGFQDRNRQNRNQSLSTAEGLFPRRTFGLSGTDLVNLELSKYNQDLGIEELNWRNQAANNSSIIQQQNADAAASGQQQAAVIGGIASVVGALAVAF